MIHLANVWLISQILSLYWKQNCNLGYYIHMHIYSIYICNKRMTTNRKGWKDTIRWNNDFKIHHDKTQKSHALDKCITNLKGKPIGHDLRSARMADLLSSETNLLPESRKHVQQALTALRSMSFLSPRTTTSEMGTELMSMAIPTLT